MASFAWHNDYSVNDDQLDHQHQQLLAIMNELATEIEKGEGTRTEVSDRLFGELAKYVMSHFAYEEQRMLDGGYPDDKMLAHRQAHNALIREMQQLQAEVEGGTLTLGEVLPFLYGDWLINHICTTDHDYVPYLARKA